MCSTQCRGSLTLLSPSAMWRVEVLGSCLLRPVGTDTGGVTGAIVQSRSLLKVNSYVNRALKVP